MIPFTFECPCCGERVTVGAKVIIDLPIDKVDEIEPVIKKAEIKLVISEEFQKWQEAVA